MVTRPFYSGLMVKDHVVRGIPFKGPTMAHRSDHGMGLNARHKQVGVSCQHKSATVMNSHRMDGYRQHKGCSADLICRALDPVLKNYRAWS